MNVASSLLNRVVGTAASLVDQTLFSFGGSGGALQHANGMYAQNSSATLMTSPNCTLSPQDRRIVDKCYRCMEGVIRLCQQPRLNLKNSPPFILDILPDIYNLLNSIFTQDPHILAGNLYLRLFLSNLTLKCKQTTKLFKTEREKIFDESTPARRHLTKNSLIFSHMLSELKAEFPEGKFIGARFRITKRQAEEFWLNSFGNRTIVSWEEFRAELNKVHRFGVGIETQALKNTIDLACNDHISNFEFDVFTRLFHPWPSLLRNWQLLAVTHPAYMAFMTYEEVKQRLQQFINKPGSYLFRLSCTRLGQWAIGYVAPDGKIYQTIPQNKSLIQSLVDGHREGFYLYPNGRNKNTDLSFALQGSPETGRVQVSSEQYQIYCEMGTTFEMCKICDERNKNVKLEPCGHLLCKLCLSSWQEKADGEKNCPFCRCEIKGTENILIESYEPSSSGGKTSRSREGNKGNCNSSSFPETKAPLPPPRPDNPPVSKQSSSEQSSAADSVSPPPIPPKRNNSPPFLRDGPIVAGPIGVLMERRGSLLDEVMADNGDGCEGHPMSSLMARQAQRSNEERQFGDFVCMDFPMAANNENNPTQKP